MKDGLDSLSSPRNQWLREDLSGGYSHIYEETQLEALEPLASDDSSADITTVLIRNTLVVTKQSYPYRRER